jgi:hypothetical protein
MGKPPNYYSYEHIPVVSLKNLPFGKKKKRKIVESPLREKKSLKGGRK